RRAGYLIVYTPFAKLCWSQPQRDKIDMSGEAIMRERWSEALERDPYYNPNLSRERADFALGKEGQPLAGMRKLDKNIWQGIDAAAANAVRTPDYHTASFVQELFGRGLDASQLLAADRSKPEIRDAWIPGIEIFARKIHSQRHRGSFGELVRREEGVL